MAPAGLELALRGGRLLMFCTQNGGWDPGSSPMATRGLSGAFAAGVTRRGRVGAAFPPSK